MRIRLPEPRRKYGRAARPVFDGTSSGPVCPVCGGARSGVVDSRPSGGAIRRRRECLCGYRFTTFETRADRADGVYVPDWQI